MRASEQILNTRHSAHEHGCAQFSARPELLKLLYRIVKRAVKLAGSERMHDSDVRGMAWAYAADVEGSDAPTQVKAFIAAIERTSASTYVAPFPSRASTKRER